MFYQVLNFRAMKKVRLFLILFIIAIYSIPASVFAQDVFLAFITYVDGQKKSKSISVVNKTIDINNYDFVSLGVSIKISGQKKLNFIWKRNGQVVSNYSNTYSSSQYNSDASHIPFNSQTEKPKPGNYEVIVKENNKIIYSAKFILK